MCMPYHICDQFSKILTVTPYLHGNSLTGHIGKSQ